MPPGKKDPLTDAEVDAIRRWIAAGARFGAGEDGDRRTTPTQHDVLPILLRRCTVCHGLRRQEGGLDLHTRAAMLRGGKSGPAIVPGKPDESLADQEDPRRANAAARPARGSQRQADRADRNRRAGPLDRGGGARGRRSSPDVASTTPDPLVTDKDRDFWAFQPPQAVARPGRAPRGPGAQSDRRVRPAKARGKGADSRAGGRPGDADCAAPTFDLTGLPPEPAEVEAFLADRAPDAYEKMIDRLLASPRYGERWGRFWLDLAGYADSEGKREQDLPRPHAWRYRDYVIRSFNADKPYDRFLLEQTRRRRAGRLRARPGDHAGDLRQPGRHRLSAHGARRHLGEHHRLRCRIASR